MSLFEMTPGQYLDNNHVYKQINKLINFEKLTYPLEKKYSKRGRAGYPVSSAFKCLLIQYWHDLSDRQLEEHLRDSISAKYFCGFEMSDQTPDYSFFSKFRERIGTKKLAEMFNTFREGLKSAGYIKEIFTFVDSSALEVRVDNWKARDRAIADKMNTQKDDDGNPTMNNKNVEDYSSDPQARFGAKGKNKIWLGYKRHVSVDMRHGLINKTAVTPANVSDGDGVKHTCPGDGAVIGDKAYCSEKAQNTIKAKGCHPRAIHKENMKAKNKGLDSYLSRLRMPFEGVFSKLSKVARYRSVAKVQFQTFMESIVFNIKRLITIGASTIPISA